MTPVDILPFYLEVAPSPAGKCTAFAFAKEAEHGSDSVGVPVILEDERQCVEIFRFSQLDFVRFAWSATGECLAFAQNSTLLVRQRDGTLTMDKFSDEVEWLGFDGKDRLWILSGRRLERRCGDSVDVSIEHAECAVVCGSLAYSRRGKAGHYIFSRLGDVDRQLACLSADEMSSVNLSFRGNFLVAVLKSLEVKNRARVRIFRFDLAASKAEKLFDEHLAFGFNGGPGITVQALSEGDVLAAFERGECTRVWLLTDGAPPKAISPKGLEVFDFAIDAAGERLAVIASDTRCSAGSAERQLLMARRIDSDWLFSMPIRGIYHMPRWRADGVLEVLCGTGGRWIRCSFSPERVVDAEISREGFASESREGYDFIRLPGPANRHAGVILLSRIHQQFIAGAQTFFFYQLLFSVARSLAREGFTVAVLNGPGATGRGAGRREPSESYFAQVRSAVDDLTAFLQSTGCRSVGILAGSLAAVTALRLIGLNTNLAAGAFLAPLFESSIPVTAPLEQHLVADPLIEPLGKAASGVRTPMLVIYGDCEEVVPLPQIRQVCVEAAAYVEICTMENEGHIFKRVSSWEKTEQEVKNFFAGKLKPAGTSPREDALAFPGNSLTAARSNR